MYSDTMNNMTSSGHLLSHVWAHLECEWLDLFIHTYTVTTVINAVLKYTPWLVSELLPKYVKLNGIA